MSDPMTTAEAAARLGLSVRGVLHLIRSGRLPARRAGRVWLIRRADLAAARRRPRRGRPRKTRRRSRG